MWTKATRKLYDRSNQRYPSDVTDAEWALIKALMPVTRAGNERELFNAVLYVLTTGCQWRQMPKDFPPRSTVHDYFVKLNCDGILAEVHQVLYEKAREMAGKEATPTLAIVDSQSVKGAEKGGPRSIPWATTRARKSRVRSVMSPSTRSG
jgi:transposase